MPVRVPGRMLLDPVETRGVRGEQVGRGRAAVGRLAVGRATRGGVAGGERAGQPVELGEIRAGFAQGVVEHVTDGHGGVEGHLLVEEPQLHGPDDGAAVRLVHPGQQAQQRGLAGAVLPDQSDPLTGNGREGDAVENPAPTEHADEVMGGQSCCGHATPPERLVSSARRAVPQMRGPQARARVGSVPHDETTVPHAGRVAQRFCGGPVLSPCRGFSRSET